MYQGRPRLLLTGMTTLTECATAAVSRDLYRARRVLADGERLIGARRQALADHLVWLSLLADGLVPTVAEPAARVTRHASTFGANGDRLSRLDLIAAIDGYTQAIYSHENWVSPDAVREVGSHVPWLVDGLPVPQGRGLLFADRAKPEEARRQLASYRRLRVLLWGSMTLQDRAPKIFV